MTNKEDKDIEAAMINVLGEMKAMQRDMDERRDKRFWSEISVPFTLHEGLSKYTKDELVKIRKYLDIKNASTLKKAELIDLLQERLPKLFEDICLRLDKDRFNLIRKIARNGGYITAPNLKKRQISYFRKNGIVYTGTFNGERILALPAELKESVLFLENSPKVKSIVSRNTEWIRLTHGLLYYYGTLSLSQLEKMLKSYTKEALDVFEYIAVIRDANEYNEQIYIDKNGYSNIRVFDSDKVKREHRKRKDLDFYPFTKEQLVKAGEPDFVDRNKSYMQFVNFLLQNYELDREEADKIVEECTYATRIGHDVNDVLFYLENTLEFKDFETIQALIDHVISLMNNTREWFLKGYTSTELRAEEQASLRPLPTNETTKKTPIKKRVKVGRNDPCPCGSGKKYKKCCGR